MTDQNPKIQPVFTNMASQPYLGGHKARYQNFEQKINDSGSNESLTDFVG